jgi:hypothetical protein
MVGERFWYPVKGDATYFAWQALGMMVYPILSP